MGFTNEQLEAINKEGSNIIVSAGAGSGKTAVLTERVIRKLKQGVDVSSLLVLTFTNEAANEMKSRIREAIIKNNLLDQLALLDSSYITTFDSFAYFIVKKYHYLLNVSSNVSIIDSNIITIHKQKLLDQIFEEMYGNPLFDKLVNDFCLKNDKVLKKYIMTISSKLDLLTTKNEYLNNYIDNFYSKEKINYFIDKYNNLIKNKILELRKLIDTISDYVSDKMMDKIDNWVKPLFTGSSYDDYVLFNSVDNIRFESLSDEGKKVKDQVKAKTEEIKKLLRFSNIEEIFNSIMSTKDNASVIIDIIKKLDFLVLEYKKKYDVYEFNDIAIMAINVVRDYPDVREEVKQQFNEIMLDEYQDTSSIQEEFISYISNNNLYMVGDVKQSIYRFRNANPYIFQEKYNEYGKLNGGIKIDLLKNFRSRSETLFNINEIFNLIMDDEIGNADYIASHNMVYGNTLYDLEDTGENNKLEIYNYSLEDSEYSKVEKELFIISDDIRKKIKNKYQVFDKKSGKLRDIKYSDICIITDKNTFLDQYKKILEYNEIPSVLYKDEELTTDDDIKVLINLISLVDCVKHNNYDNKFKYLFVSVARSFLFECSDDLIYDIVINNRYSDDKIVLLCKEINIYLPLVDVVNDIIDKFNVYECLTKLNDIDKSLIRISNLVDIANSVSVLNYDISNFVDYFRMALENSLTIKYSVNTGSGDAVKIMNIHKSKGLEFSLCYFTGMHNSFVTKEIRDKILFSNEYGMILSYKNDKMNDTILKDLYVEDFMLEEISEKIRLFYVALTRCREKMIIVTSLDKDCDKYSKLVPNDVRRKYSSFLDILNSLGVLDKYVVDMSCDCSSDYDNIKMKDIDSDEDNTKIIKKDIEIGYNVLANKHFSKENIKLLNSDDIKSMEYGTKLHEILEYTSFYDAKNEYVNKIINHFDKNFINVYKEYEFIDSIDNKIYNGIIDLMLEYDDYINIIDYKLKNISDEDYVKQLYGYKKYIEKISDKKINLYLYSIMLDEVKEIV